MSQQNMPGFTKHLLQAYINWLNEVDGKCHIVIAKDNLKEQVLLDHVNSSGFLVLNIGGNAPRNLFLGEDYLSVNLRFKGEDVTVHLNYLDIHAVAAPEALDFFMPLSVIPVLTSEGPTLAQIMMFSEAHEPNGLSVVPKANNPDNVVSLFPTQK